MTVTNNSRVVTATNVLPVLASTNLDGNVTFDASSCASIAPLQSCIITFTPLSNAVAATNFTIQGDNTTTTTGNITIAAATTAHISVANSPLTLTAEGASGTMTVTNNSSVVTATNVLPVLASTNLDGNVTFDASSCASIAPLQSCTITFTPSTTAVSATNFAIQGDNTTTTTGNITIAAATVANISVSNSPLTLYTSSISGTMTVTNNSSVVTATNVLPVLASTNLDGNVTFTRNGCDSIAPLQSCTITFTPLSTAVSATNFAIQGDNTTAISGNITIATSASITVSNSPLSLVTNGSQGSITVNNISSVLTATNIVPVLTGTALDGNVTVDASNCASVAPLTSCTISFTPKNTAIVATSFNIIGDNTTAAPASITISPPASLTVNGSPLTIYIGGVAGTLTINNTSTTVTATNIVPQLAGTALENNVTVDASNCASVAPLTSCTISFTPLSTSVFLTTFNIQGDNTTVASGSLAILPSATLTSISSSSGSASGGLGVTLTGTNLTGTNMILFDGVPATSVSVLNSTTVTAVTPSHPAGVVNVQINAPAGSPTLSNAFTYLTTAIGQSAYGGKIACMNGGFNTLIAANTDNSSSIIWGGSGVTTATPSNINGSNNTDSVVNCLTNGIGCTSAPPSPLLSLTSYAAGVCKNYQVDSQGNTPCQAGNTCYNDWFLPAGDNNAYTGQLYCLYANRAALNMSSSNYWSSTQRDSTTSYYGDFSVGDTIRYTVKATTVRARCVRAFTPSMAPMSGSTSGGLGVTLTGTNFTGATDVTFDGISASNVNVVNSTTITAVTPVHAVGAVTVQVTTPSGIVTLPESFNYLPTTFGQTAYGGQIACLNGGLNNLIMNPDENTNSLQWGASGTTTGATSTTDGASNTSTIVSVLGTNGGTAYAAKYCKDYQVDSLGNSPCVAGNTCYNDWFLPAGNNSTTTGQLYCLYLNKTTLVLPGSYYWSSTEVSSTNAYDLIFANGVSESVSKTISGDRIKCVRAFTPTPTAQLTISGSPLVLATNGAAGVLTIYNTSSNVTATNVAPQLTGTALDGKVTVTNSGCASIAPLGNCTISFTPSSSIVSLTSFNIIGDNTTALSASIAITSPAPLTVSGSPLTLYTSGVTKSLTIYNTSATDTAYNVYPQLTGTALAGKVSFTSNCASIAPLGNCTINFTPSTSAVTATSFNIQGSNTPVVSASITIAQSAPLSLTGSPLYLYINGSAGTLTITNTSSTLTATNVAAQITGTALDGKVTLTSNGCASIAPSGTCTISFTPSSTAVSATNVIINGDNTNALTASISILSPAILTSIAATSGSVSGGLGVTLTGANLSGLTAVLFDGIPATGVNVVNSTTVRAVTPPHAAGAVNVQVVTSGVSPTLSSGFTYLTTAVGQSAYGGKIACLNGGQSTLIAANADNSSGITWGGSGVLTTATSIFNGSSNTNAIVNCLTNGTGCSSAPPSPLLSLTSYAAGVCKNYQVDSQGNTPCQAGNTCYNDWFLPTGNNNSYTGQLYCLYSNRTAINMTANAGYWSSTDNSTTIAYYGDFTAGNTVVVNNKTTGYRVRCVRSFTPPISPVSGSASGGVGVTITGAGFTGATGVTFDGVPATSVNVVNSTTINAVTPAHAAGAVTVQVTTPSGVIIVPNTFTYVATTFGQIAYGGQIACLNGGLNNLIMNPYENTSSVQWGPSGTTTGATSTTDGAANTSTIVTVLGTNGGTAYAAKYCKDYQVDSQGNTPCVAGNTCYNDWFLPAGNNGTSTGQLYCLYLNRTILALLGTYYWSSTEASSTNAYDFIFSNGSNESASKTATSRRIKCVRAFTPSPTAPLTVTGSPLTLYASGPTGTLTITNTSSNVTATNVAPQLTGTALDGKVTVTSSGCASVAPLGTCTINFTPSSTLVSATSFNILGDNTTAASASITIAQSAPITVTGSPFPMSLNASGITKTVTINNISTTVTATNVTAQITGTALAGNVTVTSSGCSSIAPLGSCTINFTPLSTAVSATSFNIQGANTVAIPASITIAQSATLTVTGSPMSLYTNGAAKSFTITNTSSTLTATNVTAQITGTALDGNVTVTNNGCASIAPLGACTISFTPLNTVVSSTSFTISGDNTSAPTASVSIVLPIANLTVTGSPLYLYTGGLAGTLTVTNSTSDLTATNVTAEITGTALDGNVLVTSNGCTSISPLGSCTLSFTPLSTVVALTSFNIQGVNTNVASASVAIQLPATITSIAASSGSDSGGLGVILTGTNLSGATGVLFDTVAATNVYVVNSTTIRAVTPPHAAGAVNVNVTTTGGSATLNNGFTYLTTAVGQSAYGGKIACINGGLNSLIAANTDNSTSSPWNGSGVTTAATSRIDGSSNTNAIVNCLTYGTGCTPPTPLLALTAYAAGVCRNYQIDSQGNTPCVVGNACYNDWFLPESYNNSNTGQLYCLYTNRTAISLSAQDYWGSTERDSTTAFFFQNSVADTTTYTVKGSGKYIRCVRAFSPPIAPQSGSASGGVGVTITGTGFTGATSVTFDGVQATSVNVVNSTTITAVTPPHAAGAVTVLVTTPSGVVTVSESFTYIATAVGQYAYGGRIGCINGGLNNLILSNFEDTNNLQWGPSGTTTGATSTTNGSANTSTIYSVLGTNGGTAYAAKFCKDYQVDSQGNTPCVAGNTCYNDWFLPAGNNTTSAGQQYCLALNKTALNIPSSTYWSSTEVSSTNAYNLNFSNNATGNVSKTSTGIRTRCVRAFTP